MPTWLPLLLVLACPLMMLLMMHGSRDEHTSHKTETQPRAAAQNDSPSDDRLAELEREIADLRAARDQTEDRRQ